MKRKLFFLLLILLVILALPIIIISQPVLFVSKDSMNIRVDTSIIKSDIRMLTNTDLPRNYSNVASLNQAADYIKNQFSLLNLTVEEQKYKVEGNE